MNLRHKLLLAFADDNLVKLAILNIGEEDVLLKILFLQPVHLTSAEWTAAIIKYFEHKLITQSEFIPVNAEYATLFNRIPVQDITSVASVFANLSKVLETVLNTHKTPGCR